MAYDPLLTTDSSNAIELDCGTAFTGTFYTGTYVTGSYVTGTYYYVTSTIDVTVHSGTVMDIVPGGYKSQERAGELAGNTVVDVRAIEGEWKICKSNEENIMVLDVASFPIARNQQYIGANNNRTYNYYEFPHHHFAPKTLNGLVTEVFSEDTQSVYGCITRGDYLFFCYIDNLSHCRVRRYDMRNGNTETSPYAFPSEVVPTFVTGLKFSVIDNDTILVATTPSYNTSMRVFCSYNFVTGDSRQVVYEPKPLYGWHWGVVGNYLCVSTAIGKYPSYPLPETYYWKNDMYDIRNGALVASLQTPAIKNYDSLQYPVTNHFLVGKKLHITWHFGDVTPSDSSYYNDATMFVFDTEETNLSIFEVLLKHYGTDGEGCTIPYDIYQNPFNGMIYFYAAHTFKPGTYFKWCWGITVMSPDNYSQGQFYEYEWLNAPPHISDYSQEINSIIPGMFDLYVLMSNGHVYRLLDLPGCLNDAPLFHFPVTAQNTSLYGDPFLPQPHMMASCLDRWDRIWYIEDGNIKAVNIHDDTGVPDIDFDAGIPASCRGTYCFPNVDYSLQQLYLAGDRVIVVDHRIGTCQAECPGYTDKIFVIE